MTLYSLVNSFLDGLCSHICNNFYTSLCIYSHKNFIVLNMPRTNLRDMTLEILEDNELSKKKILEEIRKQSGKSVSDKTINEILMNLLKDGEIYITGYDFTVYGGMKRIQSIKADGLIFGQIKTNHLEIYHLISQLESFDPIEVKDASHKLKIIFKDKIEELNNNSNIEIKIKNVNSLYNKLMYYLNNQSKDKKTVFVNKLAWSLSSQEGSEELLQNLITYINYP